MPITQPPRGDQQDMSGGVVGTRVILSNPMSQGEEVITEGGSQSLSKMQERKNTASSIRWLQRRSMAILEGEE